MPDDEQIKSSGVLLHQGIDKVKGFEEIACKFLFFQRFNIDHLLLSHVEYNPLIQIAK